MANEPPILPTIREVIGPAKDALAEARPSAAPYLDKPGSVYQRVITGWRGQFSRAVGRLAAEATAARLGLAQADELTDVARSNYDTSRNEDPTFAIGEVSLIRKVIHVRPDVGTIGRADATDGPSAAALLGDIAAAMNTHLTSVYSSSTGLGSHQVTSAGTFAVIGTSTMGDLVDTANDFILQINWHLNNKSVGSNHPLSGGSVALSPAPHLDADTADQIILATNPSSANPGGAFSAATKTEQQALLVAVNTMKRVINTHFALEAPGGTIRKGTRVVVTADPTHVPPFVAATYAVSADTVVKPGSGSPSVADERGSLAVPVTATTAGTQSNQPFFGDRNATVTVQGSLFDAAETYHLTPILIRAAGGSPGQSDSLLRAAAAASWQGSLGPTEGALLAGSLRSTGVAHYAALDDHLTGRAIVYVADQSWAQSFAWQKQIQQALKDDWIGTGQRLSLGTIINTVIRVRLTVVLRDSRFLADPSTITSTIQSALKSYFDDRPDWYIWMLASIRGRVVASDKRRILKVTAATVLDTNGVPLAEPATPSAGGVLTHWRLEDNSVDISYDAPN